MAVERKIQDVYGSRVDLFSGGNDPWFGSIAKEILNSHLEETNHNGSILAIDLGCGQAAFGARLLSNYPNLSYIGVDLTPRMIEAARAKLASKGFTNRSSFIGADFRDNSSDEIIQLRHSADVVFALAASDGERNNWKHMKDITSFVRKGGLVVCLDYYQGNQSSSDLAQTPARLISSSFQYLGRLRREKGLTLAGAIVEFFSKDTQNLAKLAFDKEFKEFDLTIGRPELKDIKEFAEIAKAKLKLIEQGPYRPVYFSFVVTDELVSEIDKRVNTNIS